MQEKLFLHLKQNDYTKNAFRVDVTDKDFWGPQECRIDSITATFTDDFEYVLVHSRALSRIARQPSASTNSEHGDVVYILRSEQRVVRSTSSTTTTNNEGAGSDSSVLAIGDDLLAWIDLNNSRVFDSNFVESTGAGETDVVYVYNRGPNSSLIFWTAYGNGLTLANFGSNGAIALTRTGSWESTADTTPIPTNLLNETFCVHGLIQLNNLQDYTHFYDFYMMKVFFMNGAIHYTDTNNASVQVSGLSIIPLQQYLISIHRRSDGNAGYEFYWRLERLSNNQVMTATTTSGATMPNTAKTWRLGMPNTHYSHLGGPFIVHNTEAALHISNSIAWLKNHYTGTATGGSTTTTTIGNTYQLFSDKTKVIPCKGFANSLTNLDFYFTNPNGVIVQPESGCVEFTVVK